MRTAFLIVATALLSHPMQATAQSYFGFSPAGEQIHRRIWGPEAKQFITLTNEATELRAKIGKELEAPSPSWHRLRPLISAYEIKRSEARAEGERLRQKLFEELPAEDRLKYLKREYGTAKPPRIIRAVPPPPVQPPPRQ